MRTKLAGGYRALSDRNYRLGVLRDLSLGLEARSPDLGVED